MLNLRKVAPNLRENETVYIFARSTLWAFFPWVSLTLGLLVLGAILLFALSQVGITFFTHDALTSNILVIITSSFLLLILALLGVAFIDYYYDIHIVTDHRVITIDRNGLFAQSVSELPLEEIEDVEASKKGLLNTMFNFGTVHIETAHGEEKFKFSDVHYSVEISELILDLSTQEKMSIESGKETAIVPRGQIKGIINNKLYTEWPDLLALGSLSPNSKAHTLALQSKSKAPSPPKPVGPPLSPSVPTQMPQPTKPAATLPADQPQKTPTQPVAPQPIYQKVVSQPPPPVVRSSSRARPVPPKAAETVPSSSLNPADDLDIVIDDPSK